MSIVVAGSAIVSFTTTFATPPCPLGLWHIASLVFSSAVPSLHSSSSSGTNGFGHTESSVPCLQYSRTSLCRDTICLAEERPRVVTTGGSSYGVGHHSTSCSTVNFVPAESLYTLVTTTPGCYAEKVKWWNVFNWGTFLKWSPRKVVQLYIGTTVSPFCVPTN